MINLKNTIKKILKEEFDLNQDKTNLEKMIAKHVEKHIDKKLVTDNFYGVVVDVYNTKYGKYCHITNLLKGPFTEKDSDQLFLMGREIKSTIKEVFSDFFSSVSISTSTIDNYLSYKPWYDEKKKN